MSSRLAPKPTVSLHRLRPGLIARPARLIALAGLAVLLAAPPAHPWGAFRGVAGFKITDTHQLILRAAYDLLMNDPRISGIYGIPIAGGRFAAIESIVQYEGVDGSLRTLTPYGPGPDAEGSTLYSCHWFNPSTGKGLAPQSAADWYQRFVQAISGLAGTDEDAYKGLAWSAHFLADMFVPYHIVGMPADEALARMNARNFIIGPTEAGPAFFIDPAPVPAPTGPALPYERQARQALSSWWRDGWGVDSNFRESFAVFAANNRVAGAGKPLNHLDWFDPWYWNGTSPQSINPSQPPNFDPLTDPMRAVFSSHASYESIAHGRFVADGGYKPGFNQAPPYDPIWKNAPPDYAFAGTAWQAQAWQVQDFAAKAALRTLQNAELCWRQPEIAIRAAVGAVYTMWRSAYSALQPVVQTGRDPSRPNEGIVVQVNVQNHALEACHDARLRMTVRKGGSVVSQSIDPLKEPITRQNGASTGWFVNVSPNEEWTVVVEVAGVYDNTPDLQYGMSYAQYKPEQQNPVEQLFRQTGRPVEQAEAADFAGSFILIDPQRSYEQYHGEMSLLPDGTFQSVEYQSNGADSRKGNGTWKFDPVGMTIAVGWQGGGQFAGPVSGNTSDFTITGHWSNGGSGTLRFQRR